MNLDKLIVNSEELNKPPFKRNLDGKQLERETKFWNAEVIRIEQVQAGIPNITLHGEHNKYPNLEQYKEHILKHKLQGIRNLGQHYN